MDGSLYYVHSDMLGSTVAVSDAAGGEVGRVQYDPYGEVLTSTLPADLTDRLFTGARFDGTIGLYQMSARWYDPALGRWMQADSIVPEPGNPQALNRYSYVLGNPLRYTDPSGHQGEEGLLPPPFRRLPEGWSWWDVLITVSTFDVTFYADWDLGYPRGTTAMQMQAQVEEQYGNVCAWHERNIREPIYARFPVVKTIDETLTALLEDPAVQMGIMGAMMTANPPIIKPVAPSGGREGWQAYEARYGATHPRIQVEVGGRPMIIIPDKRTVTTVIEMKAYDFSNPAYQRLFIQECVIRDVVTQADKYLAIGQPVVFQFAQPPPSWLSEVLDSLSLDASVSYIVAP